MLEHVASPAGPMRGKGMPFRPTAGTADPENIRLGRITIFWAGEDSFVDH